MKHLFIINPAAKKVKGHAVDIKNEINDFFKVYPDIRHDAYISAWCRDAVSYIRRYIMDAQPSGEPVRIHTIGGTGTLFEVVNGVIGLSNAEVAVHPYGRANTFLQYFGLDKMKLFSSMESQIFDETIPVDIIRCGHNYGLCYGMTGIEAHGNALGDEWIEKGLPADFSYSGAAVLKILRDKKVGQNYHIDIDGVRVEGDYASILAANAPCYGDGMYPAVDAHPDDGKLEVYLFKSVSRVKTLRSIPVYTHGGYLKLPDLIRHYSARSIKITSDETMCMSIDGEHFYGTSIDYEIVPRALSLVCPQGIELTKLPLIYNKPKEGQRGGK